MNRCYVYCFDCGIKVGREEDNSAMMCYCRRCHELRSTKTKLAEREAVIGRVRECIEKHEAAPDELAYRCDYCHDGQSDNPYQSCSRCNKCDWIDNSKYVPDHRSLGDKLRPLLTPAPATGKAGPMEMAPEQKIESLQAEIAELTTRTEKAEADAKEADDMLVAIHDQLGVRGDEDVLECAYRLAADLAVAQALIERVREAAGNFDVTNPENSKGKLRDAFLATGPATEGGEE